jgi:hypothetical protein
MISTIFVLLRLDHKLIEGDKSKNLGVEVMAYTENKEDGLLLLESMAARDARGMDWDYEKHGDPFYDPLAEEPVPPPIDRFIVWDEDIEPEDPILERPTSVVASVSLFSAEFEDPERPLLRSYKLCKSNPSVDSFLKATTEGDLEMQREYLADRLAKGGMLGGGSGAGAAAAAVAAGEPDKTPNT